VSAIPHGESSTDGVIASNEISAARPRVLVLSDCDAAARAACELWLEALDGGTPDAPRRVLLAGGTTPERLYRLLANDRVVPRNLWRGIECFFGDERCVPPDHPDSNFGMVRRCLLDPLGDSAPAVHRIVAEDPSPEAAASAYEALLRSRFGIGSGDVPAFDLALQGVGPDGHTASLFPGAEPRPDSTRLVSPARRPQDGSQRITATYRVLDAAKRVVFLACGEEKRDAVARSLAFERGAAGAGAAAAITPTPASLVRPTSGDVIWVLDEAAAGDVAPKHRA